MTNVNAQCRNCNYRLSGNQMYYQDGMIAKYGQGQVDFLRRMVGKSHGWMRAELELNIKWFKERLKEMKR